MMVNRSLSVMIPTNLSFCMTGRQPILYFSRNSAACRRLAACETATFHRKVREAIAAGIGRRDTEVREILIGRMREMLETPISEPSRGGVHLLPSVCLLLEFAQPPQPPMVTFTLLRAE